MKQPFNTKISIFKNLFEAKDTPFELLLSEVFNRIKVGNDLLVSKINKIRNSTDKEEISNTKNSLMAIMFNGTFRDRSDNGLKEHSGVCILDFDKYPNLQELNKEREKLKSDKYTLMVFTSPSGYGLKALIRIPKCDKLEHKRRFNAYKKYINSEYFDEKNCNISRVCFESYDPEIFINQYCEEFLEIEEEKGFLYTEKVPICILKDEQKIIDIVMKFSWKKDFKEGERNAFIFDLAGAFCEYGINQSTAEGYILNNVVHGDFSEVETKTAIKSAYKKRNFDCKYFEDTNAVKKIQIKLRNGVSNDDIKKQLNVSSDIVEEIKEQLINNEDTFWEISHDKKGNQIIKINPYKYSCFLAKNGFKKYYPETAENPTFVRTLENKVKISSPSQIKDFVLSHLLKVENLDVWNYCTVLPYLFTDKHLNMIDSIHLQMLVDLKNEAFIPFRNGVVKVSKNKVELIKYIDVDGYIWENQIINRDFEIQENYSNDFQDFVSKVSNNDINRIECLETTLGYLIHTFKDKTDQKSIIFNDQEIDDNPNGGSGKSLMLTALNNFRKVVKIDGKAFDPKKSDFVYQRVNLDTQILAFDDVKKNFNFEQLFALITEGITVNRKNKDEIFIPFERSPKIIITTNYVINGSGSSHERRRHEVEFYQYFNNKRSPLNEYGRLLFDSWNKEDWEKFDNYMIYCLQLFLKKGLTTTISINSDSKRLIQSTNKDFYDWINDNGFELNKKIYNSMATANFISEFKNYKDLNAKTLLKWIDEYCKLKGHEIQKGKDNEGRFFKVLTQEENTEEENDQEKLPF